MKAAFIATLALLGSLAQAAPAVADAKPLRRDASSSASELYYPVTESDIMQRSADGVHKDGYDYDFYYVLPAVEAKKVQKRSADGYDYDFYYVLPAVEAEKVQKRSDEADGYDYDFYYVLPEVERKEA